MRLLVLSMLVLGLVCFADAKAQTGATRLVCDGNVIQFDSGEQYAWSGAIVTVEDNVVAIDNMPMFSATWPIYRTTESMIYIVADTGDGRQVQGNLNRLNGDLSIFALSRPVGHPGSRFEAEFRGQCAAARRMF